jgi:DNA-binding transcriptional LysR family regulator
VEFRQLEAVVAIDSQGSFSGAAAELGTVQSNVSTRVARLEAELGAELVDRATGALTEAGRVVVERARRVLAERSAIEADVAELTATVRGPVALGMIGTAGRWIVPLMLAAQRERYPHVRLRIVEGTNTTLVPQVLDGHLDLAVLAWPVDEPELRVDDLFDEDLVLVAPRGHELARRKSVSLTVLSRHELLLPLGGTPIRRELDAAAAAHGVELRPLLEMDGLRTIASLTFDGLGLSILPASMLTPRLRGQFVAVRVEGLPRRRVVVVERRYGFPPAPARAVAALLAEVVAGATDAPRGVHLGARPPR